MRALKHDVLSVLTGGPAATANAFADRRVLLRDPDGDGRAAGRLAIVAGGRRYGVACPHGRTGARNGPRAADGLFLVLAAGRALVRLGVARRRDIRTRVAFR